MSIGDEDTLLCDRSVHPISKRGMSIRLRLRSHFGHGLLAFKQSV